MSHTALLPFKKNFYQLNQNNSNNGSCNNSIDQATSESQSEISSIGSDFNNDLKLIAVQLNVSVDDLKTERFKVDRQKIGNMIKTNIDNANNRNQAEEFFEKIMKETSTHIGWPSRLKIGAKTKRDPNIRVVGKPDDVSRAKERIMLCLDSRGDRVILKMDVSYTDHSFIISRGGRNIQKIMEETSTHIHFPDSNRSNSIEKSNQVSLCGNLEGVEKARHLVRASAPVVFSFELPIIAAGHPVPDNDTIYVKEIEQKYNVQIIFSTRAKLHSSLVLVKGSEVDVIHVKKATKLLIERISENITNTSILLVQMQIDIAVQNHFVVAGKSSENLRGIMKSTGTEIIFPDANDCNVKPIKRSQVTITGTIEAVYAARQQLIGSLPVTLIFDHPENTIDMDKVAKLMKTLDVFINVRPKFRQSNLCIVIKGIEKFIGKVYEARQQLLSISAPTIIPQIPQTYYACQDGEISISSLLESSSNNPPSPITPVFADFSYNLQPSMNWNFSKPTGGQTTIASSNMNNETLENLKSQLAQNINISSSSSTGNTSLGAHGMSMPTSNNIIGPYNRYLNPSTNYLMQKPNLCNISTNTSGYQSFSSSTNSLEQSLSLNGTNSQNSSRCNNNTTIPLVSSSCVITSPDTTETHNKTPTQQSSQIYDGQQKTQQSNAFSTLLHDFECKKIYGLKAMQGTPVQGEARIPTPVWAGMSLSCTSPIPTETPDTNNIWKRGNITPYNMGVTTSLLDVTPRQQRQNLSRYNDLHTLMVYLGLEHYIKTFIVNEIDLEVFKSLSDNDLKSLGITALGARRKLLLAIRDLCVDSSRYHHQSFLQHRGTAAASSGAQINSPPNPTFSGSAAPGAERRMSGRW